MHRSDEAKNSIDNFPQKFVFSIFSLAKSKNIVFFAFTFVLDSFGLFYGDFCMDLYGVDSDKGMKRWSIKRFIASIFEKHLTLYCFIATIFYSALNASSPLLLKVILPTSATKYMHVVKIC